VIDLQLDGGGTMMVAEGVFDRAYNEALVHQAVVAFLAGARGGTRAQKSRSDVAGGGRKPWRQKGTGNARAGSNRSPLWRGGGRAFAARPRNFAKKVNRKMYRGALRSLLSELYRRGCLHIVEELSVPEPKTKLLVGKLRDYDFDSVLIVTPEPDENIMLAANNLPGVGVLPANRLDPVNLMRFGNILASRVAVEKIQKWLA